MAIKVLREDLAKDKQAIARFFNEARAANAIRHPNIVEVIDCGTAGDGQIYLVMELLEGEELSKRLKRFGRLPFGRALEVAYQTASAVGAAHASGIIHRDLKPDNLFLVPDEQDRTLERVKVLDFGIAKLQTTPGQAAVKTHTGALLGTPIYMAPEQCLGTKDITLAVDVYSLGCILFEMLAGRPPFMSEGVGELIHMHIAIPPPTLTQVAPGIPPAIDQLVARMLAKNPHDRPADMKAVQAALKDAAGPNVDLRAVTGAGTGDETSAPAARKPTANLATAETQVSSSSSGSGAAGRAPSLPGAVPSIITAREEPGGTRRVLIAGGLLGVAAIGGWLLFGNRPAATGTPPADPQAAVTPPPSPPEPALAPAASPPDAATPATKPPAADPSTPVSDAKPRPAVVRRPSVTKKPPAIRKKPHGPDPGPPDPPEPPGKPEPAKL